LIAGLAVIGAGLAQGQGNMIVSMDQVAGSLSGKAGLWTEFVDGRLEFEPIGKINVLLCNFKFLACKFSVTTNEDGRFQIPGHHSRGVYYLQFLTPGVDEL